MFCSNCGSKIADDAKFCQNCGHPVKMQAESTVAGGISETTVDTTSEVTETAGVEASPAGEVPGTTTEAASTVEPAKATENAGVPEEDVAAESIEEDAASGSAMDAEQADGNVTAQYARHIEEQRPTQSGVPGGQFSQTQSGTTNSQFNQSQNNNLNGGINVGSGNNNTQPKSTISTVGQVLCIVGLVLMFFQIFHVIGSGFGILGGMAEEGFLGFVYGIINFGMNVLRMCGLVLSALVMYLVWKKWDENKVEPLVMGTVAGGVLILITVVLRLIFGAFFNFVFGYDYASLWSGAFLSIVFAVAMMVIIYTLVSEKQLDAFAGLRNGNFAEGIKKDFKDVAEMAVQAKEEYQSGRRAAQYQPQGNAQNGVNQSETGNASQTNAYGQNAQPYNGTAYAPTHLDTDRSIVAYILLGLITCSIYSLYMLHCIIQDVNVTCRGDGKETKGILEYIVFGIITCGIYDYVWLYKFGNRIQENAPRYGMHFQESGTTILLWFVFGSLLCGIGPWIGMYYIIRNTNALNAAYNNMMAQQ